MMSTIFEEEYQLSSKQRKLNTTPITNISELPEISPRQKKNSSKLNKNDIKYQRFLHNLENDIKNYMNQCLRENHFDTGNNQYIKTNPIFQTQRTTSKSKRTPSTIVSQQTNKTKINLTLINNQQDPIPLLKHNQINRLENDIQRILTGPALKNFYIQFLRPFSHHQPYPFEKTFL